MRVNGAREKSIHALEAFIECGFARVERVELDVVEIPHRWRDEGGESHRQLCAIARNYLRNAAWNSPAAHFPYDFVPGDRRRADVRVRNAIAECGNLNGNGGIQRILSALRRRRTVLLIPFASGAPIGWLFRPHRWLMRGSLECRDSAPGWCQCSKRIPYDWGKAAEHAIDTKGVY